MQVKDIMTPQPENGVTGDDPGGGGLEKRCH
jgi:hypothetical protein